MKIFMYVYLLYTKKYVPKKSLKNPKFILDLVFNKRLITSTFYTIQAKKMLFKCLKFDRAQNYTYKY